MNDGPLGNPYLKEYLQMPGQEIEFVVERDMETQARDGSNVTISTDALDQLQTQFMTFVGTRLMQFHLETGFGAQRLSVEVKVSMEA